MRLDVASLPEDTDPQPASCLDQSKARSRSAARIRSSRRAAGAERCPRHAGQPGYGELSDGSPPRGLQGRSRPAGSRRPACPGRAETGEGQLLGTSKAAYLLIFRANALLSAAGNVAIQASSRGCRLPTRTGCTHEGRLYFIYLFIFLNYVLRAKNPMIH